MSFSFNVFSWVISRLFSDAFAPPFMESTMRHPVKGFSMFLESDPVHLLYDSLLVFCVILEGVWLIITHHGKQFLPQHKSPAQGPPGFHYWLSVIYLSPIVPFNIDTLI